MGKRNPIVHIEWRSRQTGRLKDFYRQVFGWKFEETMPGYLMAATGTKDVSAGFMQIEASSTLQPGIVSFLEAEDLGGNALPNRKYRRYVHKPAIVLGQMQFSMDKKTGLPCFQSKTEMADMVMELKEEKAETPVHLYRYEEDIYE